MIAVSRSDIQRLKREKSTLHDKVRELEHQLDTEKRRTAGLRKDLLAKKEQSQVELAGKFRDMSYSGYYSILVVSCFM